MQGTQVQSLVRELKSHMLWVQQFKKKRKEKKKLKKKRTVVKQIIAHAQCLIFNLVTKSLFKGPLSKFSNIEVLGG